MPAAIFVIHTHTSKPHVINLPSQARLEWVGYEDTATILSLVQDAVTHWTYTVTL